MPKGDYLGEFELLVMLAVIRLGRDAYGMLVLHEIEEQARRRSSIGAVYATLERLVEKGFLKTWLAAATEERGGKRKRFHEVTASGATTLNSTLHSLDRMRISTREGVRSGALFKQWSRLAAARRGRPWQ
jgi:PadR family transcriptional regulator PadR